MHSYKYNSDDDVIVGIFVMCETTEVMLVADLSYCDCRWKYQCSW